MTNQSQRIALFKLLVLLIIVFTTNFIAGCNQGPQTFAYGVRVIDANTGESIAGADARITDVSIAPLRSTTDRNGLAIFAVPLSHSGQTGRLIIDEVSGYEDCELHVFLSQGAPSEVIKLKPTSSLVADATNAPSSPQIGQSTPVPTPLIPTPTPAPSLPDRTFTCLIFSFGSYFPTLQIVQERLDEQNDFHLELIPWDLPTPDGRYDYPFEELTGKIRSGEWDCMLDTLDGPAREGNYGVITAVIDESAGADQVWARANIETINDIKGRRVSFVPASTSEFMLYALLDLVGLDRNDINPIAATDVDDAVAMFNRGEADVVIGWEPNIVEAAQSGGGKLIDSSELRYIVDTITVSQQAIDTKPDVVQAFHRAWFQALKIQFDDFSYAAQSIADWGSNEWTFVNPGTASADLGMWLESIAQAGYGPNLFIMQNPTILYERLRHAQSVWSLSGIPLPSLNIEEAVNPQFVLSLQGDPTILPLGEPYNTSFIMAGQPPRPVITKGVPIAELPCTRFEFLPDSVVLTNESQKVLDECALPALRASTLYLRITGSSAWPGPVGRYSETEIANFADQRARAIAQYISNRGIDPNRLLIDFVIPPLERRESTVESELEKDRFVRLQLETTGQR
jgi:hypothetical protein